MTSKSIEIFCFVTARKRSLGQGNAFTRICQSVRGGGKESLYDVTSCPTAWSHVPPGEGAYVSGPCSFQGVSAQGVLSDRDPLGQRTSHPGQRPLWYGKERGVRILLECIFF